jgi:hypothetical protein
MERSITTHAKRGALTDLSGADATNVIGPEQATAGYPAWHFCVGGTHCRKLSPEFGHLVHAPVPLGARTDLDLGSAERFDMKRNGTTGTHWCWARCIRLRGMTTLQ